MTSVLWLIFALLFLALAVYHAIASRSRLPEVPFPERTIQGQALGFESHVAIGGSPLDEPIERFVASFNSHVSALNGANAKANRAAAAGYSLAALTAGFSYFLQVCQ